GENRAAAVSAIGGSDCAVHRLDKPARDRKAQARSCPNVVEFFGAVELVEYPFDVAGGEARPLVLDADRDFSALAPGENLDQRAVGGILRGVVEQVEYYLFEENGIDRDHRQAWVDPDLDPVPGKHPVRAFERAIDRLGDVV